MNELENVVTKIQENVVDSVPEEDTPNEDHDIQLDSDGEIAFNLDNPELNEKLKTFINNASDVDPKFKEKFSQAKDIIGIENEILSIIDKSYKQDPKYMKNVELVTTDTVLNMDDIMRSKGWAGLNYRELFLAKTLLGLFMHNLRCGLDANRLVLSNWDDPQKFIDTLKVRLETAKTYQKELEKVFEEERKGLEKPEDMNEPEPDTEAPFNSEYELEFWDGEKQEYISTVIQKKIVHVGFPSNHENFEWIGSYSRGPFIKKHSQFHISMSDDEFIKECFKNLQHECSFGNDFASWIRGTNVGNGKLIHTVMKHSDGIDSHTFHYVCQGNRLEYMQTYRIA